MASERIINEYDSTRIANAVDTLASNLADYSGTTVTPTDAMKAKLPSQTTEDRIAGAVEALAQNVTDLGKSADDISYDSTSSGLPASNVQAAIDEVNSNLSALIEEVTFNTTLHQTANTAVFIGSVDVPTGYKLIGGIITSGGVAGLTIGSFTQTSAGEAYARGYTNVTLNDIPITLSFIFLKQN